MSIELKHTCHACDVDILYPDHAKGSTVACPKCGTTTTLGEHYPRRLAVTPSRQMSGQSAPSPRKGKINFAAMAAGLSLIALVAIVAGLAVRSAKKRSLRKLETAVAEPAMKTAPIEPPAIQADQFTREEIQWEEFLASVFNPDVTHVPKGFLSGASYHLKKAAEAAKNLPASDKDLLKVRALVDSKPTLYTAYMDGEDLGPGPVAVALKSGLLYNPRVHSYESELFGKFLISTSERQKGSFVGQNAFGASKLVARVAEDRTWFYNLATNSYPPQKTPQILSHFAKKSKKADGIDGLARSAFTFGMPLPGSPGEAPDEIPGLRDQMFPERDATGRRITATKPTISTADWQKIFDPYFIAYEKSGSPPGPSHVTTLIAHKPEKIECLYLLRLAPPFIDTSGGDSSFVSQKATFSDPKEVSGGVRTEIFGKIFGVCLVDEESGEILAKIDLARNASEQVLPSAVAALDSRLNFKAKERARLEPMEIPELTKLATKSNSTKAKLELALRYLHGEGVPLSVDLARNFITSLTSDDVFSPEDQLRLALIKNLIVEKAALEANRRVFESYKKSASAGSASAQYELGIRYLLGKGVEKNEMEGVKFLRAAAEQDYSQAKKKLAELGIELK